MNDTGAFRGSLFAGDFLRETIAATAEWRAFDDGALEAFVHEVETLFARFAGAAAPNEAQTEDDLIWPVLERLGWTASLRQQNLSPRGRGDVPDGLLFADDAAKRRANRFAETWRRYEHGLAIVESKRWRLPLDRRSEANGPGAPASTQMLRYLRRVDDVTNGKLRWGVLTNGAVWRLYRQGARSVSEEFFELDLAALVGAEGLADGERRHWLKVFALMFGRAAFLPGAADARSFHLRAIDEGRFYRERIAADISRLIFERVFPSLARAIAAAAPAAPLPEVREAALIALYRLLFLFYAEDRGLLPVRDPRYEAYALRENLREHVGERTDKGVAFPAMPARYWQILDDLCRIIDSGDPALGLPPYNGGLFDRARTPLLAQIRVPDATMAEVVDALSFERTPNGLRRYINYRDLGVQQLGSIYERLLEREVARENGAIVVRPNRFARKDSGSFYTPDDLVGLIVSETLDPLVRRRIEDFEAKAAALEAAGAPRKRRLAALRPLDPAERLVELRVCDPAMGSGHFLVAATDYLTDRIVACMAEAEGAAEGYVSPLMERVEAVRETILRNAEAGGWAIDAERLDDRHIVRRMALKRCVFGVDKNPMAVELAKVTLWLHTFTAGAPLSFLDHHLRCGDSLFGSWVRSGLDRAETHGNALFPVESLRRARGAVRGMAVVESLTDAEIAETDRSAEAFREVRARTAPLDAFLSLVHALDWLNVSTKAERCALHLFFAGRLGDPVAIACGEAEPALDAREAEPFASILECARRTVDRERFFNWQIAFPGVWTDWESAERTGGFDAVIGNPPWDRMRIEAVEWFAIRRPDIAKAPRAADRKRMVAALHKRGDPLAEEYAAARERAEAAGRVARASGEYPLLAYRDLNLYALFVERAMALANPGGTVGLLTPSGIASDKSAARFFKSVATEGRLKALYDFENKKRMFRDVHPRFKFCVFVAGRQALETPADCAFFLHETADLRDPARRFTLTAEDFARVNPNTGTAPIFRSRRDAELTSAVYGRMPALANRLLGGAPLWPVVYTRMFDMSLDSKLFRTREELQEKEGAWSVGGNRFASPSGDWVPLYEGKMVQAYDHRAANVVFNPDNLHRPAQPLPTTAEQRADPNWSPNPLYWVSRNRTGLDNETFLVAFKHVTAPTNIRTMIAAILPCAGAGNSLPLLRGSGDMTAKEAAPIVANLNAIPLDYIARQKVQGQNLNWFVVEQLPVVPLERFDKTRVGPKTAGDIVRGAVLELTYTAHDMAPFARDLGHVDDAGAAKPPFAWNEERRLELRAKLDALFFRLYGITDRDDIRYIYSTFPIVERDETKAYGRYLSRDLCLAWTNALAAGRPDAKVEA